MFAAAPERSQKGMKLTFSLEFEPQMWFLLQAGWKSRLQVHLELTPVWPLVDGAAVAGVMSMTTAEVEEWG